VPAWRPLAGLIRSLFALWGELDFVVGVDPHRDSHALGVVEVRGGVVVFEASVAADSRGYAEALRVAERHAPGRRAFAIEGAGSFGAGLTRFLVDRGKTDALDAVRAARSVLTRNGLQCHAAAASGRHCGR
jgi:transposase